MKKIRIFDIQWDTSNDEGDDFRTPESLGLPAEHTAEVNDDFDPEEECADLISDKFGYCVFGCSYEWVEG